MGFLDSVVIPGEEKEKKPKTGSRFLSSVTFGEAPVPQAPKPKPPSLLSSVIKGGKEGYEAVKPREKSLKNLFGPVQKEIATEVASTWKDSFDRFVSVMDTANDPEATPLDLSLKTGEAAVGVVNAAFAPMTAALKGAATIPKIGHVADAVNIFFSALGSGASTVAIEQGVDRLPVSEQTKEKIRPLAGELAALAAQIAAGKAGEVGATKFRAKQAEATQAIKDDIAVQVKIADEGPLPKNPIKSPNDKHAEYARSQGYEPYMAVEELPIIKFGPKAKEEMPTIQTRIRESANFPEGMKLVPDTTPKFTPAVRGGFLESVKRPEAATEPVSKTQFSQPITEGAPQAPLSPVASTGEVKTSRLAENVETNAVERRLVESETGNLPEYRQANMAEQAQRASQLLNESPEQALRIALGEETAPIGIIPEAVFVAVENRAIMSGDGVTMMKLARESNLSTQATAMGQRIRTLGERDQLSPVKVMSDVTETRAKSFKKTTGKDYETVKAEFKKEESASLEKELKKAASKRQDWESFMKDLTCGIE